MSDILLTVSGTIDPAIEGKIARGQRPRADYLEMARGFDADLIDYARARRDGGVLGKLIEKFGGRNALLAWACWRKRGQYRVIFTDGEQMGIPLALLLKFLGRGKLHTKHLMIVHILSVGKKMLFFDKLKIASHVDLFFVYSTWQKHFIEERWHVPSQRVIFTPFMVDDQFFSSANVQQPVITGEQSKIKNQKSKMICAVGLERRDYPTLMHAVRDLPVQVIIAAASPWSKQSDTTEQAEIPANVTLKKFTQYDLRQLYADSAFMVMPLYNVNFQAGVTAILEAMALERAVICSRTPGQTDVIVDGETGLYVPPEDASALRAAIQRLIDDPDEAARLGRNGRKLIEEQMNLEHYVERLKSVVEIVKSDE
jgi:glycosyltransferase involved in cell wall biosynthesis